MITMFINTFWTVIGWLANINGISSSITNLSNVIQPITSAVTTVNGYLSYTFYFLPKATFLFILAVTLAVCVIRITMAIINLIVW